MLPDRLQAVVDDFAAAPMDLRIDLLVEYSAKVPEVPAHLREDPDALERVDECQTPFFLATEVDDNGQVQVWFDCPPQAPTTRGFAGVLTEGLNGTSVDEVLAIPIDFHHTMGLATVISPLRMRGMDAILRRLKRNLADRAS